MDTHPFQQALLGRAQSPLCDPIPGNGAARSWSSIHGIPIELLLSAHTHAHAHAHTGTVEEKPQAYIVKAPLVLESKKKKKKKIEQEQESCSGDAADTRHHSCIPPFCVSFFLFFFHLDEKKKNIRGNAQARGEPQRTHTHTHSHTDILQPIHTLTEPIFSPSSAHSHTLAARHPGRHQHPAPLHSLLICSSEQHLMQR